MIWQEHKVTDCSVIEQFIMKVMQAVSSPLSKICFQGFPASIKALHLCLLLYVPAGSQRFAFYIKKYWLSQVDAGYQICLQTGETLRTIKLCFPLICHPYVEYY